MAKTDTKESSIGYKSRIEYAVEDASKVTYSFPFAYLRKQFVHAQSISDNLIHELTYGVDYTIEDLNLTLTTGLPVGTHLIIYRQTVTDKVVTWNDGSMLLAKDMNTQDVQLLHLQEEQQDYIKANSISSDTTEDNEIVWDAQSHRVSNVGNPTDPQDAVTKSYMESVQDGFVQRNTTIETHVEEMQTDVTNKLAQTNTSASNAKTSETNAKASETKAKTSETNAKQSESNAKTSETNAKTSETNASTSEFNALNSANSASLSEANAKTSETKAKTSENSALASANTAQAWAVSVSSPDNQADTNSPTKKTMSSRAWALQAKKDAQTNSGNGMAWMTLRRNATYAVGDIAYSPNLPSWAYLECVTAGTTGDTEPDFTNVSTGGGLINDSSVAWRLHDIRCKYELGDIVPKIGGNPMEHEHLLLCDGSSFDTTKYVLLAELFPNGKLPDLNGRFLQGSATAGKMIEAGLPNITGSLALYVWYNADQLQNNNIYSGAFHVTRVNSSSVPSQATSSTAFYNSQMNMNASLASNIYGKSNTVQPPSYTVKYYICYGG